MRALLLISTLAACAHPTPSQRPVSNTAQPDAKTCCCLENVPDRFPDQTPAASWPSTPAECAEAKGSCIDGVDMSKCVEPELPDE
jgi:hypothetical protein